MGQIKGILAFTIALVTAMPATGQSEPKDIPFELHNGYLIVVRGSIGKLKNLSFVVDTGTSQTIVDERIARKLHLNHLGSVEQLAPTHVLEMRRTIVEGLSWGGRTFKAWDTLTFDFSSISRYVGKRIDGLLGLNLLCQTSFQIDYQSRKIHFESRPRPENSVQFEPNVPILIVDSRIDGHSVKLLLDTGSDSLAVFADRLPRDGPRPLLGLSGHDVSGPFSFTPVAARQVLLGASGLQDTKVFLIPTTAEAMPYDGFFGPTVLGASKIYFDFDRMRFGWDFIKGSDGQIPSSQTGAAR